MKTGLFFGSFNPVHVGHLIIADHMIHYTDLDEIWMVVSPHNPLKKRNTLANDYDRLHLVNLALGEHPLIKSSNIEFGLPKPSYTIDTLTYLKEKYPNRSFALIMGGDNLATIHKWKNYEILIRDYEFYVYHRKGAELNERASWPNVHIAEAPMLELSSTYIRRAIQENKDYRFMLSESVYNYIEESNMYRSND